MAPCERVEEFSDGALTPEHAEAFREHLGTCEGCQQKLRELAQLYVLEQKLQRQPAPTGNGPEVLPVVLQFLTQRQEQGARKYGTTLRALNGRDALRDAKEEAADQLMYLTQLEMEWPALVAKVREQALQEVEQLLERQMLHESDYQHGELARVTAAVSGALRRVYADVRELLGKPPVAPEPHRPRARKQHRWQALPTPNGAPKRWECQDCPLERWVDKGPRGGPIAVFAAGGVELARGPSQLVHVPSCPPSPKGGG
jgi:hypothetical protein